MSIIEAETALPAAESATPEEVLQIFRAYHQQAVGLSTRVLDEYLLGVSAIDSEAALLRLDHSQSGIEQLSKMHDFDSRYPGEKPWHGMSETIWTPYHAARSIIKSLLPGQGRFYDLGAGYGRVTLYAAINGEFSCSGIEMVAKRAAIAQRAVTRLALANAEVVCAVVQNQDFSDGDIFYMYSPFSHSTYNYVLGALDGLAADKPITVIERGPFLAQAIRYGNVRNLVRVKQGVVRASLGATFYESAEIAGTTQSRLAAAPDQTEA